MPIDGEYEPSPSEWVRNQVEQIESSGGAEGTTLRDMAVVIVTSRGARTGKVRKNPVMRVEHEGRYAAVASMGGAPKNPVWYYNLVADPEAVTIQDGPEPFAARVHELHGDDRTEWWDRAGAAYPPYAEYQEHTDRIIPIFVATRR